MLVFLKVYWGFKLLIKKGSQSKHLKNSKAFKEFLALMQNRELILCWFDSESLISRLVKNAKLEKAK